MPLQTADAVELLRLGAFFSNAALVTQLGTWLGSQMAGLPEETVLEVRCLQVKTSVGAEDDNGAVGPSLVWI